MGKMFFWTQGRNYGKSQFFKQMEEMIMSRNKEVPIEATEGFEITEVTTNKYRTLPVKDGIVMLDSDETIRTVTEKRKEDPAIYNPENLVYGSVEEYLRVGKEMTKGFEKGINIKHDSIQEAVRSLQEKSIEPEVYVVNTGEAYAGVIEELSETFVKKNADYGNSFEKTLDKRGLTPAIIRMEEKMERMEKLWETNKDPEVDESIIDSAMDLANYAIMTAMWLKKIVPELPKDVEVPYQNSSFFKDGGKSGADYDGDVV